VNVYDSTKAVLDEVERRTSSSSSPCDPQPSASADLNQQFKKKIDKLAGAKAKSSTIREAVGYDFLSNLGTVVYQKDIEVDLGKNLKKR